MLKGDANTAYFHAIANGRRRKCAIVSLKSDEGIITDKLAIQSHIYDFYRDLYCSELCRDSWALSGRTSAEENHELALSFLPEELDKVLQETKTDTAPGPDGLPVLFFKSFWPLVRHLVLHILNGFALGLVDISRLNFGVLSLIPKVPGADSIKQF